MKTSISLMLGKAMNCENWLEIAQVVKNAGFDGIDLDMCVEPEKDTLAELERLPEHVMAQANAANAAGLEISQCHLPYWPGHIYAPGNGSYEDFEAMMLPFYRRALDLCGKIGCKTAVIHPYLSLESRNGAVECNVRLLRKLLPDLERLDVAIALENVYAFGSGHYLNCPVSNPEAILEIIQKVASPYVGACIDTGHANISGYKVDQMARIYGKHLLALHINSNTGGDDHIIPYATPSPIDFHAFSSALKEIGYTGTYNLELYVGSLPISVMQPYYAFTAAVARALADEAE